MERAKRPPSLLEPNPSLKRYRYESSPNQILWRSARSSRSGRCSGTEGAGRQRGTHRQSVNALQLIFKQLLEGLLRELSSRHRGSSLFVEGIAQSLAGHLARTYADETTHEYKGGLPGFRLHKVRALMVAHLADGFSLIRLAREAGMTEFHFSRAFKRTTGFTPSQYFIDLRLEKARRLLRETNRSAIEIGLEVGYTSPSHFARIFRREVGISPSEYRRMR